MVERKTASQITKVLKNQYGGKQTSNIPLKTIRRRYALIALIVAAIASACTPDSPPKLSSVTKPNNDKVSRIWWDKGFTLEEDEALQQLVSNWKKQTGNSVKLSFYTTDELSQKTQRAIQSGNPPDMLMSNDAERVLNPRLAWEGKLADVSDVVSPIQSLYPEIVISLPSKQQMKRSPASSKFLINGAN